MERDATDPRARWEVHCPRCGARCWALRNGRGGVLRELVDRAPNLHGPITLDYGGTYVHLAPSQYQSGHTRYSFHTRRCSGVPEEE